mmetsp:Transcript_22248/g.31310  ORF Transcript_22248/g.31310 Transcript_22248/m.31310 type:complete len:236 (+) Transcript_22248:2521-3228(+)
MGVIDEEVGGCKQFMKFVSFRVRYRIMIMIVVPIILLMFLPNTIEQSMTSMNFFLHDTQCLPGNARRTIHGRIGRGDNGSHLPSHTTTHTTGTRNRMGHGPYGQTKTCIMGTREHDGIGPSPILEHQKEFPQERCGRGIGIQLHDQRHADVDVHSSPIPHLVAVQSLGLGPFTDAPYDLEIISIPLECAGHEGGDEVGDAWTVERFFRGGIDTVQYGIVVYIEMGRYGGGIETCE